VSYIWYIILPNFRIFIIHSHPRPPPPFDSHSPLIGIRSWSSLNEPSRHILPDQNLKPVPCYTKYYWSSAASTSVYRRTIHKYWPTLTLSRPMSYAGHNGQPNEILMRVMHHSDWLCFCTRFCTITLFTPSHATFVISYAAAKYTRCDISGRLARLHQHQGIVVCAELRTSGVEVVPGTYSNSSAGDQSLYWFPVQSGLSSI